MKVKISGMSCGHCKKRVEEALNNLEGIDGAVVDLENGTAEVNGNVDREKIKEAIEDAGYDVTGFED